MFKSTQNNLEIVKKAVILDLDNKGLAFTRMCTALKIPSFAITADRTDPAIYTNSCKVITIENWTDECVIPHLLNIARDYSYRLPLITLSDRTVLIISRNRQILEPFYEIVLPDNDKIDILMSKNRFTDYAIQQGWSIPKTWNCASRDELNKIIDELTFPCIIKPFLKNKKFREDSLEKAIKLFDVEQTYLAYAEFSQWEPEVVIQEWIPGDDSNILFCLGYWSRDNKPLMQFAGEKIRQFPIECGNTSACEPLLEPLASEVINFTNSIAEAIKFKGFMGVEFKMHSETKKLYIIEPTVGRPDHQIEVAIINGFNIPAIAYYDMIGKTYKKSPPKKLFVQLVSEEKDFMSAYIYYKQGKLSLKSWLRDLLKKKKFMLFRLNDPLPALVWVTRECRHVARYLKKHAKYKLQLIRKKSI